MLWPRELCKYRDAPDIDWFRLLLTLFCPDPELSFSLYIVFPNTLDTQQQYKYTYTSQKNGYDLTACDNVRDILYNIDVITSTVKLIVYSPAGKSV